MENSDMDDLLREIFPETHGPQKVPLLSSLLQDIESKGYKCKLCERSGLSHKLRFFIINETTEIFKCESRTCMFPNRNFIFRDRVELSFYTYKDKPKSSASSYIFNPGHSEVPETPPDDKYTITELTSPSVNPIIDDFEFSIITEPEPIPEPLLPSPMPTQLAECVIPSPTPPPPSTVTKSINVLKARKPKTVVAPTASTAITPKNIKSPLELVKELLKRKGTVEQPKISESLNQAAEKVKELVPLLSSPQKATPVSPKKTPRGRKPTKTQISTPSEILPSRRTRMSSNSEKADVNDSSSSSSITSDVSVAPRRTTRRNSKTLPDLDAPSLPTTTNDQNPTKPDKRPRKSTQR